MNKTYNSISITDLSATTIIFGEELSSDGPRLLGRARTGDYSRPRRYTALLTSFARSARSAGNGRPGRRAPALSPPDPGAP